MGNEMYRLANERIKAKAQEIIKRHHIHDPRSEALIENAVRLGYLTALEDQISAEKHNFAKTFGRQPE